MDRKERAHLIRRATCDFEELEAKERDVTGSTPREHLRAQASPAEPTVSLSLPLRTADHEPREDREVETEMTVNVKEHAKSHYDKKHDILYLGLKHGDEEEFVEIANGVNAELNDKKEIIGIEIFKASKFLTPLLK